VVIGSYVYYSHFINLKQCSDCGLAYADARIDDQTIISHFETAYKSEEYFTLRSRTYEEVLEIIMRSFGGGRLLDVGCAKGHFLETATTAGFHGYGCDLSESAVAHCRQKGLTVQLGEVRNINYPDAFFDVITCLDTLYYSRSLKEDLEKMISLVRRHGILCFRIPHRNVRWLYYVSKVVTLFRVRPRYRNLLFFNPEHCYVFEVSVLKEYLERRGLECAAVEPTVEGKCYKSRSIRHEMLRHAARVNRVLRVPLGSVTVVVKKR
jgi:2-polyprenyl-3-methyl-5-hydroxy-6-metoxy-1,4-benzoquinol methylase